MCGGITFPRSRTASAARNGWSGRSSSSSSSCRPPDRGRSSAVLGEVEGVAETVEAGQRRGSATRSFRLTITPSGRCSSAPVRGTFFAQRHRLVQVRQRGAQVADARLQQAREVGELGEERLLHRQRAEARLGTPAARSRSCLAACGSDEIAPKAIAPFVNCSALSTATGATMRAASASSGKKRTSCVVGSARAAETGLRFCEQRVESVIASFSEAPRAARHRRSPSGPAGCSPGWRCRRCCRRRRTRPAAATGRAGWSLPTAPRCRWCRA